jgi:hypothetical protein
MAMFCQVGASFARKLQKEGRDFGISWDGKDMEAD